MEGGENGSKEFNHMNYNVLGPDVCLFFGAAAP